jgi:hypothetical protein
VLKAQEPKARKPASAGERIALRRKALEAIEALRLKREGEEN